MRFYQQRDRAENLLTVDYDGFSFKFRLPNYSAKAVSVMEPVNASYDVTINLNHKQHGLSSW